MADYISYTEIPKIIGLKKGDRVYLSSDILMLSFLAMKNGEKFDLDKLLDSFIEAIGVEGTLLVPTFNFDFSNKGYYDIVNTCLQQVLLETLHLRETILRGPSILCIHLVYGVRIRSIYVP